MLFIAIPNLNLFDVSIFYLSCRNGFYHVLNCPDHDRNRRLLFTWKIS